jgi:hypothetical protein
MLYTIQDAYPETVSVSQLTNPAQTISIPGIDAFDQNFWLVQRLGH